MPVRTWINPRSHNLAWLLNPVLCWFECLHLIRTQRNRATCLSKNLDASIYFIITSNHTNPRWWPWVTSNKRDEARGSRRVLDSDSGDQAAWCSGDTWDLYPSRNTSSCMSLYYLCVAVGSSWIYSFLKYFYSSKLWTTAPSSGRSRLLHLLKLTSVLHMYVTVFTEPASTDSSVSYVCVCTHTWVVFVLAYL